MAKHYPGKSGPKPRVWTEKERMLTYYMAIAGVPHTRIAKALGTAPENLRAKFRHELDCGIDEIKALAAGQLVKKIREGNVACLIFYLKTQCGWRETTTLEHKGDVVPVLNLILDESSSRSSSDDDQDRSSHIH